MGPEYVVIGHLTRDIQPDGSILPGGTVTYAAVTARNLGRTVGVITSSGPDVDLGEVFEGIEVRTVPASRTTTMANVYVDGTREQYVQSVASPLGIDDVPPHWLGASVVHLGPLVMEVDWRLVNLFPNSLLGVTPQGWMREWGPDGRVRHIPWDSAEEVLGRADVLVFSEEDVGGSSELLQRYSRMAKVAVVTDGWRGAVVHTGGRAHRLPSYRVREVDPTGAGDVFAAAYLIALEETGNPIDAGRFANAAASFNVEAKGPMGIPTRADVESRLRHGRLRPVA